MCAVHKLIAPEHCACSILSDADKRATLRDDGVAHYPADAYGPEESLRYFTCLSCGSTHTVVES